jgi:uncharacterized protein (TIGR03067 family)
MRTVLLLSALFCSTVCATEPKKEVSVEDELKKLEGTWVVDGAYVRGKEIVRHRGAELVFRGTSCTSNQDGRVESFEIRLDPSKKVKQMDSTEKGTTVLGVYDLDGDNLKICFGEKRPNKVNSDDLLYVLKRAKK